ncbi:MAG: hypothetical protein Q8N23_34850 [Archangium sp.]|nr:hypothetical protein [Archangium sp.]MDP3157902.1 hypothetical protein [Archangium sp.]MDP3571856.1 hypothetical protein [Archangium sp.]
MNTKPIEEALTKQFGEPQRARVVQGVRQVAALWRKEDGDLAAFAKDNFIVEQKDLDATFARFEANFEQLDGHLLEIGRELQKPTALDVGPLLKVDPLFAEYDPSAHLTEDLFNNKLGFVVLLNFPLTTLEQRLAAKDWSRQQWAAARLAGRFSRRVPAAVQQEITSAQAAASLYIDEYNVWMHHVLAETGERLFPRGKRLISHWNLRDELKAQYADKDGLARQRTIIKIMERIVTQTIPASVIDNPTVDWNPFSNTVVAAAPGTVEEDAPKKKAQAASTKPEPDVRYARLLANYASQKKADPFSPIAPTAIDRAFSIGAEMPEARVKELLESVLASPLVPKIAAEIEKKVGRKLEPTDLWFNGFLPRGSIPEKELDAKLAAKYPNAQAFAKDIPRILQGLGFPADRAKYLSERILVDPSRGAGHALQAARRGDFPHLRTRVEKEGMNYKGYNIAVHELGHNVEQVFSLYDIDHTLLAGVPNTAFTEAIAFVFQAKDLELLGLGKPDAEAERLRVLNDFWMTWEIAGVALVDIEVWHWMYDHPKATPAQLRAATVEISKKVWNKYYAPVLGGKDTPLLGIYSHMISYPMYLFNYPLGHLIAFQIEEQVKKTGKIGPEIERMSKFGAVTPDAWMLNASGEPVSSGPLLRATEAALKK